MARLAIVKKQREDAAKKKEEEKKGRLFFAPGITESWQLLFFTFFITGLAQNQNSKIKA